MADKQQQPIDTLLNIMAALRNPEHGCPWDIAQDFTTIAPYTIEEAYEVADAIVRDDMPQLCDELGDLLFQVVFHARMAEECGAFTFDDVVAAICAKLKRRHPHVFGNETGLDIGQVKDNWETIKAREREQAGKQHLSALDDIAQGMAALQKAGKLQARAARVGFDWDAVDGAFDKLYEETHELAQAVRSHGPREHQWHELGDVLFSVVNLARHLNLDSELALGGANQRFADRFKHMERAVAAQARSLADCDADELERLWHNAKQAQD